MGFISYSVIIIDKSSTCIDIVFNVLSTALKQISNKIIEDVENFQCRTTLPSRQKSCLVYWKNSDHTWKFLSCNEKYEGCVKLM